MDRQFRLQLGDALLRRRQLRALSSAEPRNQLLVDAVLTAQV
jgi:hypothetical protein